MIVQCLNNAYFMMQQAESTQRYVRRDHMTMLTFPTMLKYRPVLHNYAMWDLCPDSQLGRSETSGLGALGWRISNNCYCDSMCWILVQRLSVASLDNK